MWQPIESAPKDGNDILVRYEMAGVDFVHIAWWNADEHDQWQAQGHACKEDAVGWWSYVENSVSQLKLDGFRAPTHWAPFDPPEH